MERERAEVAGAEAAAVMDDGELYLLDGGHAAEGFIRRVIGACIGQGVDLVHFSGCERQGGRVLHENALAMRLQNGLAMYVVGLVVLQLDRPRIGGFVRKHVLIRRAIDRRERDLLAWVGKVAHAADAAPKLVAFFASFEVFRHFDDGVFAHAVHQSVRAG